MAHSRSSKGDTAAKRTGTENPGPSRALLRYLYLTSCLSGAAVMIVEILGAKMLAPYFGTSHFVWTAQIAVTLASLALGYYAGGRLADRSERPGRLYAAIMIAALALVATVAVRESLAYALLSLPLAAGSLLAAICLFFVPLFLLAMTGPFVVRTATRSLSAIGATVGRISSISTLGSFIGTGAIGYLLIPLLPNSVTMYGTAAVLALLSGIYFLSWGRSRRAAASLSLCVLAGAGLGVYGLGRDVPGTARGAELYRRNSAFGLMQVIQDRESPYRYFLTDYLTQNVYDTSRGSSSVMFTYMLEGLARAYAQRLDDVLCIGLGVGIVPRNLAASGSRVDVVEINPALIEAARDYFDLDPSAFDLIEGDGRWYLNSAGKKYDAVILDAFSGDGSPSHLMSLEAFEAARRVLKSGGVLVINTFVDFSSPRDYMGASLYKTLSAVFPGVVVHGARNANTLFVASLRSPLTMLSEPSFSRVHPDALSDVREAFAGIWKPDAGSGIVLTDDRNPVDFYDAKNRERLRRQLALGMRSG
jgi:spermidine synthase